MTTNDLTPVYTVCKRSGSVGVSSLGDLFVSVKGDYEITTDKDKAAEISAKYKKITMIVNALGCMELNLITMISEIVTALHYMEPGLAAQTAEGICRNWRQKQ